MPANLTHRYHRAEDAYRRAATLDEELHCLEWMLRELPKHKGTDRMQADLRQRISRAKKEIDRQAKRSGKAAGSGVRIPRQGAGRVLLIGAPNVGKSQLLAALTRATPAIAPYPFTTRQALPGMMAWEDITFQLIDTPPINADVFEASTQGLIRGAELVLLVADVGCDDGIDGLQSVLDKLSQTKTRLATSSYLDALDIGVSYTNTLLVMNKIDVEDSPSRIELLREFVPTPFRELHVSARQPTGLDRLGQAIFESLDVVRVYTKVPGSPDPDYRKPFTIRRGGTLFDIAELIHGDLARRLSFARVWGSHGQSGTIVRGDYIVCDKDIVEIHT